MNCESSQAFYVFAILVFHTNHQIKRSHAIQNFGHDSPIHGRLNVIVYFANTDAILREGFADEFDT